MKTLLLLLLSLALAVGALDFSVDFETPENMQDHLSADQLVLLELMNARATLEDFYTITAYTYMCANDVDGRSVRVASDVYDRDPPHNTFYFEFMRNAVRLLFVRPNGPGSLYDRPHMEDGHLKCTVFTWTLDAGNNRLLTVAFPTYPVTERPPATFYSFRGLSPAQSGLSANAYQDVMKSLQAPSLTWEQTDLIRQVAQCDSFSDAELSSDFTVDSQDGFALHICQKVGKRHVPPPQSSALHDGLYIAAIIGLVFMFSNAATNFLCGLCERN